MRRCHERTGALRGDEHAHTLVPDRRSRAGRRRRRDHLDGRPGAVGTTRAQPAALPADALGHHRARHPQRRHRVHRGPGDGVELVVTPGRGRRRSPRPDDRPHARPVDRPDRRHRRAHRALRRPLGDAAGRPGRPRDGRRRHQARPQRAVPAEGTGDDRARRRALRRRPAAAPRAHRQHRARGLLDRRFDDLRPRLPARDEPRPLPRAPHRRRHVRDQRRAVERQGGPGRHAGRRADTVAVTRRHAPLHALHDPRGRSEVLRPRAQPRRPDRELRRPAGTVRPRHRRHGARTVARRRAPLRRGHVPSRRRRRRHAAARRDPDRGA